MTNAQKRAIGSKMRAQDQEIRRLIIEGIGLLDEFRRSKYSSYGWFLRSKGLLVDREGVKILDDSPYKDDPRIEEVLANG